MLSGKLDSRGFPRVNVTIRGPLGVVTREAVVDTGFTGDIALPQSLVYQLGLLRQGIRLSQYADGSFGQTQTYWVVVEWLGKTVGREAHAGGTDEVLIGARLLHGHVLAIDYGPARSVEIR